MFSQLSAPLAGTKRDADNVRNDAQSAPSGLAVAKEHRAEHIDPRALCCRTCPDVPCCNAAADSRPSKRRASVLKVAEFHSAVGEQSSLTSDADQQFPDTCFEQFCQDCELEPTCTSPCALPCPGDAHCSEDDACWDPDCDQIECIDSCADPECTKKSCPDDPCFCQKCDVQPCPLGDPQSECHLAHTAPTTTGTIVCYDSAPCHFQDGYHGFDPNLSTYEPYPCFSPSHEALGQCDVTAQTSSSATPALSPGNYTSLESAFSSHSSPAPRPGSTPSCFLNIPFEHCHMDTSCCHGTARECGDGFSSSQNHFNIWNSTSAQGSGLENSFLNFGFQTTQPIGTLSLDMASSGNATAHDSGLQNMMLGFDNSSWILPSSHFPNSFETPIPGQGNKLDFLTLAIQNEVLKQDTPETNTSLMETSSVFSARPTTSASTDSSEACVCRWQHGPDLVCLATFDTPSALHAHVKISHVDNCSRCFCQWENCESCSKDFKQRSKLSRHLLAHAGYRPYACSFEGCTKTFATNQAKDNHERTHTGDRPYVCDRCGYTTTTHTQLQTHISALHLNQKPHKCRFCDFTCADSSNLSKHERTHQTLRPYRCPHPNCTFKPDCRWENLKRHLRRSNHCPKLLIEGSKEYRVYRESVRREIDEWHKRNEVDDGTSKSIGRRKGRG